MALAIRVTAVAPFIIFSPLHFSRRNLNFLSHPLPLRIKVGATGASDDTRRPAELILAKIPSWFPIRHPNVLVFLLLRHNLLVLRRSSINKGGSPTHTSSHSLAGSVLAASESRPPLGRASCASFCFGRNLGLDRSTRYVPALRYAT